MRQGEKTNYIQYTLVRGSSALEMEIKALVNYRDFHSLTHAGDWRMNIAPQESGVKVLAFDDATPFYLKGSAASREAGEEWYVGCYLGEETGRGLSDREDRLFAALFRAKLEIGSSVVFVATTEANAFLDGETVRAERANYEVKLFQDWQAKNEALAEEAPSWLWQLILAADQFIVKRSLPEEPDGRSIIAGYHWFGDWGRDTMIALPGLTLPTGKYDVAQSILRTFAKHVDQGLLPNRFPDAGETPEYNTLDATLWFFEAARAYLTYTGDFEFVREELYLVFADIIAWHVRGTRYGIKVSPSGLLSSGEPGVQLTWMDAKVGDWVVTPRRGKPAEIQALWYNALCIMEDFARQVGDDEGQKRYCNMATVASWICTRLL